MSRRSRVAFRRTCHAVAAKRGGGTPKKKRFCHPSFCRTSAAQLAEIVTILPLTLRVPFPTLSAMPQSENPLHQPHDKLVKSTFSDPDNARAFLEAHLPRKLTRRVDWSTLTLVSGSFIDPGIQQN